ncbi:MAG: hypothetical protein GY928_17165 [Colwellia sp.]|nr:hypothetical protein [Colwellia sp.]
MEMVFTDTEEEEAELIDTKEEEMELIDTKEEEMELIDTKEEEMELTFTMMVLSIISKLLKEMLELVFWLEIHATDFVKYSYLK